MFSEFPCSFPPELGHQRGARTAQLFVTASLTPHAACLRTGNGEPELARSALYRRMPFAQTSSNEAQNRLMKTIAMPFPLAPAVNEFLRDSAGPVAIHAGHFMLVPHGDACRPTVATEASEPEAGPDANPIRIALNHFALETWRTGVRLAADLRSQDREAALLTLVNDWQYMRESSVPDALARRRVFYALHSEPFPTYRQILNESHIGDDAIMALGRWKPFISESWLRRRIERRLKRLMRDNAHPSPRLAIERHYDGTKHVVFDDFGRACRLLVCGQSDCAGEVMELVCLLHEQGYRRLVNLIPMECEVPVNEGTRRAIAVFGLTDFAALNIAVPCLAASWQTNDTARMPSISRVFGERVGSGDVDAVAEAVRYSAG